MVIHGLLLASRHTFLAMRGMKCILQEGKSFWYWRAELFYQKVQPCWSKIKTVVTNSGSQILGHQGV